MRPFVALIILAACSSKDPAKDLPKDLPKDPPKQVVPPPIDAAPPAVALATCMNSDAALDTVKVTATEASWCSGEDAKRSCWHADVASGAVEARPVVAPVDFVFPDPHRVITSPDGKTTAQVIEDTAITITDVATKKTVTIKGWKTPMGAPAPLTDVQFAGGHVLAWINATPVSSKGRLFGLDGKKLADIGDADFTQNVLDTLALDATTFAFKQLDSDRMILVDVTTGKTTKTVALKPLETKADLAAIAGMAPSPTGLVLLTDLGVLGAIDRTAGTAKVVARVKLCEP